MIQITIAILLGVLRATGITHPAFQAVAHLFVGGLLGAWLVQRKPDNLREAVMANINLWTAVALSVLELVCFLYFKFA